MAEAALALFTAGEGLKITSTLMQGWMADYESRAEQRLAERNATILEQNADARLRKAKFDQLRHAEAGERVVGRLTARAGASGIRMDVGASFRVITEQAEELELENYLIGYAGQVEAAELRDRATMQRYFGEQARRRGKNARTGSILGAFGQAASGYAMGSYMFGK